MRKKRRVRMYICKHCGTQSPAGRKLKGEDFAMTVCPHCFFVGKNEEANTWLAHPLEGGAL